MNFRKPLLISVIAFSLLIPPSTFAAQKTTFKSAGRTGATVVNTILSGSGAPSKTLGIDGDFYIDTKFLNIYGPKTKGVWKIATSLKQTESKSVTTAVGDQGIQGEKGDRGLQGLTGAVGPMGLTGAPGARGSDGAPGPTGATGPSGSAGPQGATGPSGSAGATGATGAAGANGATGAAGANGVNGLNGVDGVDGATGAQGATGANGVNGLNGVDGAQGLQGPQGIQGATGATGAAGTNGLNGGDGPRGNQGAAGTDGVDGAQGPQGPVGPQGVPGEAGISWAKFAVVPSATLAITAANNFISQTFFTADVSGNYSFLILVSGLASFADTFKLNAEIVNGSTPLVSQFAIASDALTNANGVSGRQYGFTISGIASNVSIGTVFAVRITNQTTVNGGNPVVFGGRALINKVGTIG
jgi:hypothetical protein